MPIRSFSSQLPEPSNRDVDNNAPDGFRQELIDVVYQVYKGSPRSHPQFNEANLHKVITQSLGFQASGNPTGGFRYAVGRDVGKAEWPRVYDLVSRLWDEIPADLKRGYEAGVNRILRAYRIAWDLGPNGELHRVVPPIVQREIEAAFRERLHWCPGLEVLGCLWDCRLACHS